MTVTPVRAEAEAAPKSAAQQPAADDIAAAAAIQGANPFIGLTVGQVI